MRLLNTAKPCGAVLLMLFVCRTAHAEPRLSSEAGDPLCICSVPASGKFNPSADGESVEWWSVKITEDNCKPVTDVNAMCSDLKCKGKFTRPDGSAIDFEEALHDLSRSAGREVPKGTYEGLTPVLFVFSNVEK